MMHESSSSTIACLPRVGLKFDSHCDGAYRSQRLGEAQFCLGSKADISKRRWRVCFAPKADLDPNQLLDSQCLEFYMRERLLSDNRTS